MQSKRVHNSYRMSYLLIASICMHLQAADYTDIRKQLIHRPDKYVYLQDAALINLLKTYQDDPESKVRSVLHTAVIEDTVTIVSLIGKDLKRNNLDTFIAPLYFWFRFGPEQATHIINTWLDNKFESVDIRDSEGNTPLHKAWHPKHITLLLQHGANVQAQNNDHKTPLYKAIAQDNMKKVELLLQHGAPIEPTLLFDDVLLLCENPTELIGLLVKFGADINAKRESYGGYTPLHRAARYHFLEITEALLRNGANANITDNYNATPLSIALVPFEVPYDNIEKYYKKKRIRALLTMLIEHTDVTRGTYDGKSPIEYCRRYGDGATLFLMESKVEEHKQSKKATPQTIIAKKTDDFFDFESD